MKISDVKCYYTGGGVYIYSAKYGNSAFLYGSFDQDISVYSVRGEVLFQDEDACESFGWTKEMEECNLSLDKAYISPEKIEYPTWGQILNSLSSYIEDDHEIKTNLLYFNPNLRLRTCDEPQPADEENTNAKENHGFVVTFNDLTPEAKDRFLTYFGNDVDDDMFVGADYFYYTGEGILTDPEDKRDDDPDSRPTPLITDILEAFESFLEEKGIDVPNSEKDDDPEASTIYGSDYGDLCDKVEAILKSYGIDKNSVS